MHLELTLAASGILGLIYLALSFNVVRLRVQTKTVSGDGRDKPGCEKLQTAIRSHANFAEYVPLALILLGGLEASGAPHILLHGLALALIAGRIMHPIGMTMPAPNVLRGGGAMLTWVVLAVESIAAFAVVF